MVAFNVLASFAIVAGVVKASTSTRDFAYCTSDCCKIKECNVNASGIVTANIDDCLKALPKECTVDILYKVVYEVGELKCATGNIVAIDLSGESMDTTRSLLSTKFPSVAIVEGVSGNIDGNAGIYYAAKDAACTTAPTNLSPITGTITSSKATLALKSGADVSNPSSNKMMFIKSFTSSSATRVTIWLAEKAGQSGVDAANLSLTVAFTALAAAGVVSVL